uniref:SfiI-subtelomeric related protein family member n=1 Tax=Theileria annulata TaxID=5874 RepID=A0A3B0NKA1_THEAN
MKRWIITLNLLFYITFLNQWKAVESNPTSSSTGSPTSETAAVDSASTKSTTTVTKVTIDISKSKDTDQFNYLKNGDFRTFTPKPGYLFNKVVKKSLEIWNAKPEDHGLKAVLMGSKKEPKHLAILLKNNNFVLLRKVGKNKPWNNITSTRHDLTKLKFLGEADTEIKSSDFKVTLQNLSYTYRFNTGVSCKKINLGDDELWTPADDPNYSSIKSFSLGLASNQFSVTNSSDQTKKIEKEFKAEGKTEATPITLDIEKKETTDQYDYTDDNGIATFTPKDGHVFNKIVMKKKIGSDKILWESSDIHSTLVRIMTKTAFLSKTGVTGTLAILLSSDTFRFFIQTADKWNDATTSRHDVNNLKLLGENDTELKSSDYKVDLVDLSFTYIFNPGVKCQKITYSNVQLWSHSDDTDYPEIKSFSLNLLTNTFSVMNQSDQTKELDFNPTSTPASQSQSATDKSSTTTTTLPSGTNSTSTNGS